MKRIQLEQVFLQLSQFGSLRDLQRVLRKHRSISGRSFEEILENILDHDDHDAWEAVLSYAHDVFLFGSKSFQLLSIARDVRQLARQYADGKSSLEPLDLAEIVSGSPDGQQKLAGVLHDQAGMTLVFRSRKTFTKNTPIEEEWVLPEHRKRIAEAEKAYLVETKRVSVIEALEIPYGARHGSARLVTQLEGYSADEPADLAANRLIHQSAGVLGVDTGDFSRVDLFPAIRNIYDDPTEGRVVEMHFDCSTGAGRTEKMRRSPTDLRQEAYHTAGIAATTINPYRISVRWESSGFGHADVTLPGVRKMLHQTQRPRLTVAHVSPALGKQAYSLVMQRVAGKL